MRVRFAPSPTGRLHLGNLRTALVNWLVAAKAGGAFVLRLDDTDRVRSRPEHAAAIVDDLAWLGLAPDEVHRQSDRTDRYAAAFARLRDAGRVYPCYETQEELGLKRAALRAAGRPPVYDRAALRLDEAARAELEAQGRRPHWRFRLGDAPVDWTDGVQGPKRIPPGTASDPVVLREDQEPLYVFASVVDDIELGITDIIRGEDHVANTAAQIELFAALGGPIPRFAHLAWLIDAEGKGLSKRLGSLSAAELREQGVEPLPLAAYLATIGSSRPVALAESLAALAAEFDLGDLGRAPARFDLDDLARLSADWVRAAPYAAVSDRLPADFGEALWAAVRGNLTTVAEAAAWLAIVRGDADLPPADAADADLRAAALAALPPEPWDAGTWRAWTAAVAAATGLKGKALFLPLRRALTGRDHGPELAALLPLIGRARTAARLGGDRTTA